MKKKNRFAPRMILGGILGVAIITVAAGLLAVQIKPELKKIPPWSWFAATPYEQAFVCKQDVNINSLCDPNTSNAKPAGSDGNIIRKNNPVNYRADFYMPLP